MSVTPSKSRTSAASQNSTPPNSNNTTPKIFVTPGRPGTSAGSQSQAPPCLSTGLREELKIDLSYTLSTDFDDALKFNLFQIVDSPLKDELTAVQIKIERLERIIDDAERTLRYHKKRGQASQPEDLAPTRKECNDLKEKRNKRLDELLDVCLQAVLPICNDPNLQKHISDYSSSKSEQQMYGSFVRLCNHALSCLRNINLKNLKQADSCQWLFHVSDTKPIVTDVQSKPDIVITSIAAASDVADLSSTSTQYDKGPATAFEMNQVVCCGEFKFQKDTFRAPKPREYDTRRITKFDKSDDKDLDRKNEKDMNNKKRQSGSGFDSSSKRRKTTSQNPVSSSKKHASKEVVSSSTLRADLQPVSVPSMKVASQVGQYGMEMLSYAVGKHRAITFLIHNYKLWLWYYDRQGAIQSDGIHFIKDLPRFLLLLLTFQRFGLADWGVIPELNPEAVLVNNPNPDVEGRKSDARKRAARRKKHPECIFEMDSLNCTSKFDNSQPPKINIRLKDWVSPRPHCLAGRATAVLGATDGSGTMDLVFKFSFPEVARHNEGELIDQLRRHIESDEEWSSLAKHLPNVKAFGDMPRYGTQRIRSIMNVATGGARTARWMASGKLQKLTSVQGLTFLKAWLEVVRFHAYLWTMGVEHGDPSLWNVMYDKKSQCGILGDYDLSVLNDIVRVPDQTGTIPFMALDLLNEQYWKGEIERQYRHELEAFLWFHPFVSLRFNEGEEDRKEEVVGRWMTSDYDDCRRSKRDFLDDMQNGKHDSSCKPGYKDIWFLVGCFMDWVSRSRYSPNRPERQSLIKEGLAPPVDGDVTAQWPAFVKFLKKLASEEAEKLGYLNNLVVELNLERRLDSAKPFQFSASS